MRMQGKKESAAAIEKIKDINKKTDMKGCHKVVTTKININA